MKLTKSKILKHCCVLLLLGSVAACSEKPNVGEQIVNSVCVVCHAQGINGAPIIGNKKMWSKRLPQGEDVLIEHAINGYELMPAKGGSTDLSDEEIAAAVRYMMSQVEE